MNEIKINKDNCVLSKEDMRLIDNIADSTIAAPCELIKIIEATLHIPKDKINAYLTRRWGDERF